VKKMKKTNLLLLILCLITPIVGFSVDSSVLFISPTARSIALGEAGVTFSATSEGLFYNIASITSILRTDIRVSMDIRSDNKFTPALSAAIPLVRDKIYLGYSMLASVDSSTNGDFSAQYIIALAFGPFDGFSVGIAEKMIHTTGSNGSFQITLDMGFMYQFKKTPLRLGLSMQNIFLSLDSYRDKTDYPYVVRFGGTYSVIKKFNQQLDISMNMIKAEERDYQLALGVEFTLEDNYVFRLGYLTAESLPRVGLGYKNISVDVSLNIDLSFQYTSQSGAILKISIGVEF